MTNSKLKYAINSGVRSVVTPSVEMRLNPFGLYEYRIHEHSSGVTPDSDLELKVDAMSDESMNESELSKSLFSSVSGNYHPVLGYYTGLYAGYVDEGDFRALGSSGGLTTWILVRLLEENLIDAVVHMKQTGPDDSPLFRYGISNSVEEIKSGAKSQYYPGELSGVLAETLESGKRYAVTGIPSFITEIRLLEQVDPKIAEVIRYHIGLICGHQKSTKYAEALAWEYGISPGNLRYIDFRKKNPEGKSSEYFTEMSGLKNGEMVTITVPHSEPFASNWGHGFFKPPFSDFTDDAFNETADIALGDAWLPEYDIDGLGNNVVVARDPTIDSLIQDGIREGKLRLNRVDEETILRSQRGLVHHTQVELGYRLHKADRSNEWRPQKRVAPSNDLPFLRKRVQDTRQLISENSHIMFQRAVERNDWSYFENQMRPLVRRYRMLYLLIGLTNTPPKELSVKIIRKARTLVKRLIKPLRK